MGAMSAVVTKVGSLVGEHGETAAQYADKAGKATRTVKLAHTAATAQTFHDKIDAALDAGSMALALASAIPVVNEASAVLQAGIAVAKAGNHLAAGDTAGAGKELTAGLLVAGAEIIPGGGIVAKGAQMAMKASGAIVASSDVSSKGGMPDVLPGKTPEAKLAANKSQSHGA